MNGKKAKAIRRMCAELGHFKKEPEYVVLKKTPKVKHVLQPDGKLSLEKVERITIGNKSRIAYRKAKRMYRDGEFTI